MTLVVIGWIVIGLNLTLVALNTRHMLRLRRTQRVADQLVEDLRRKVQ